MCKRVNKEDMQIVILMVCSAVIGAIFAYMISSPNANTESITDNLSGCEYLITPQGHITPRIGADFMHAGCRGHEDD